MIKPLSTKFLSPSKKFRRLSVLLAIHNDPQASQHKIGRITHLSSSMVNNYIKELHEEGLLEITGDTNRTQRYHLTISGKKEFISLLLTYSAEIVQLYAAAKHEVAEKLKSLHSEGIRRVALFGAAETAEMVHSAIQETPLKVTAVVDSDPNKQGKPFNGFIIQKPEQLNQIGADAIVITSFARQEEINKCIRKIVGEERKIKKLSDL